jgi:hypothetical protein
MLANISNLLDSIGVVILTVTQVPVLEQPSCAEKKGIKLWMYDVSSTSFIVHHSSSSSSSHHHHIFVLSSRLPLLRRQV